VLVATSQVRKERERGTEEIGLEGERKGRKRRNSSGSSRTSRSSKESDKKH